MLIEHKIEIHLKISRGGASREEIFASLGRPVRIIGRSGVAHTAVAAAVYVSTPLAE